ncbi:hypothetical protein [Garciella nitratireducens]|uniref:hypothetical protein n=1 Tax=Garciella nitratireducens TaxID=218205 RepID=UPI001BD2982C|nr:hypothetical protein [Garciella nitratireducens]
MDLITDSISFEEIADTSLEDLVATLQGKGCGRFCNPQKLAKSLFKAIRDSYRLGKVMRDSVDVILSSYARMIKTTKKQIKELDKAIL